MDVLLKAILLFGLNLLDALLTVIWVRNNWADEGNALMANLLNHGEPIFLLFKILVGALGVLVFYRWAHLRITKIGVTFAVVVYLSLMAIHLMTGISALHL